MTDIQIRSGHWDQLAPDLKPIREQVFIQEQQIASEDEWDADDAISLHFVMYSNAKAIATARLLDNHYIGRVAVLKAFRGLGLGHEIMLEIIEQAKREKRPYLKLSAQVQAVAFYQGLGFQSEGDTYLDCNIPHIDMAMSLEDAI